MPRTVVAAILLATVALCCMSWCYVGWCGKVGPRMCGDQENTCGGEREGSGLLRRSPSLVWCSQLFSTVVYHC